jgi:NAD(P)-dependent dehydrogenase (short-subunit alcohol dehydrogenase family)
MKAANDLFSLQGRSALVTGGSAGIGKTIAEALVRAGAQVRIVARDEERARRTAEELSAYGDCRALAADVTELGQIETLVKQVESEGAGLDILVNNAGRTAQAPLGAFPEELWDSVLSVNLKAPFMLTQALLPLLKRRASRDSPAHVINIGSGAGISIKTSLSFSYYASKAGLHHLTRVLADNLVAQNIHVNAIAPGYFYTELVERIAPTEEARAQLTARVPMGRFASEDDMAAAILFLATSSYITGHILPLDGGVLLNG